jgi:hypothetical protein
MQSEQRTAVRYRCHWVTHYGERELRQLGRAHDVSETGALIEGPPPKVGALVTLQFDTAASSRPVLLGHVVRHASAAPGASLASAFGVRLLSDRTMIRELLRVGLHAPIVNGLPIRPGAKAPATRLFKTAHEYEEALALELKRGGLSFSSATPVALNQPADVEVSFRWSTRKVLVSGRVVRCAALGGRYEAIVVFDEPGRTLERLAEAAGAPVKR